MNKKNKAFTLLELLVVIAIIGVLASIVMAGLNSARSKAKESALLQEMEQMSKLLEIEYNDYNSYSGLFSANWISSASLSCEDVYGTSGGSVHKQNALEICKKLQEINGNANFFIGNWVGTDKYSISIWLGANFYCIGSSGKSLPSSSYTNGLGCLNNP